MEEPWSPVAAVQEPWRLAKKAHEKPTENIARRLAETGTTVEWALELKDSVERALGFGGGTVEVSAKPSGEGVEVSWPRNAWAVSQRLERDASCSGIPGAEMVVCSKETESSCSTVGCLQPRAPERGSLFHLVLRLEHIFLRLHQKYSNRVITFTPLPGPSSSCILLSCFEFGRDQSGNRTMAWFLPEALFTLLSFDLVPEYL
ncbi:hypothetical protein CRENBAI_014351 [Crenichthys baileyi]|uniref:Uncharacterized protein n=1 Tax=Crenichthys baileyi TaxID=28760 RepID=A0AAV9S5B9_9TELE